MESQNFFTTVEIDGVTYEVHAFRKLTYDEALERALEDHVANKKASGIITIYSGIR